ncbi:MAG: ribokinase [Nocardioidaceae bacterium]
MTETGRQHLLVVGGANVDLVAHTAKLPRPGQTVLGDSFAESNGGKGANQAVAAARLGMKVARAAAVGGDRFGTALLDTLRVEGVDVADVRVTDRPTGVAIIVVDDQGENTIVVTPGANSTLVVDHVDFTAAAAVLCQLEIPLPTVQAAAARTTGLFCLNASPMSPLPGSLLARCDLVIVNESEYEEADGALDSCPLLALTLGERGAVLLEHGREIARAASPDVTVVDAVGAGDAFAAALVEGILGGRDRQTALERACRAGALAVSREGAVASLPYVKEL